ncbi:hypothetical protein QPK87_13775 [Kamptonema cortianum]|nr:hypothetical protein [Geitlerinema splendidum]MDK3157637.1 hypothetical protein [Kamptonema cortianum]
MNGGEIIAVVAIAVSGTIFIVLAAFRHHRRMLELSTDSTQLKGENAASLKAEIAALRDTVASLAWAVENQSDVKIDRSGLETPVETPPPFEERLRH